jgi:hypothetical protein
MARWAHASKPAGNAAYGLSGVTPLAGWHWPEKVCGVTMKRTV